MVIDGNRRWARQAGFADPRVGHRYGAEHIHEVLGWCALLFGPQPTIRSVTTTFRIRLASNIRRYWSATP
ncbi:undecaprenyl diphosphate synthase family protein [Micromonospora sp. NPDC047074]|uniref:undecaprenyl diphosphate synthase family protein n=1 Tax=Micromonospora sp. NPDC047074 TaxID=3154339 RepID=UPI0033D43220